MRWLVLAILAPLLLVSAGESPDSQSAESRPVILIHGFASSSAAWDAYTRSSGFLDRIGRRGFSVGDGQAPGQLRMGNGLDPSLPTATILGNASALRDYIAGVRRLTGARQVDLVAHSMGGLVARAYIDRLMPAGEVAQLIMLGTPNAGSACAELPTAVGLYQPAALELRPSYIASVFDAQVHEQHGVPFFMVAGTAVSTQLGSPCAEAPSDLVVSRASVAAVNGIVHDLPVLHTDLAASEDVFEQAVRPLLEAAAPTTAGGDQPPLIQRETLDFTRVFPGRVPPGGRRDEIVQIDEVAVASFALFDPTRSLDVEVRGASGGLLHLSPEGNDLRQVDDPDTLVRIGYGVNQPRPGAWRVALTATDRTPLGGAPYALSARVRGGARLTASTSALVVALGNPVKVTAQLDLGGQPLLIASAAAWLRRADGAREVLPVSVRPDGLEGEWRPDRLGVYGLDLLVHGVLPDGTPLERTTFLAVEAIQDDAAGQRFVSGVVLVLIVSTGVYVIGARRATLRRRSGQPYANSQ